MQDTLQLHSSGACPASCELHVDLISTLASGVASLSFATSRQLRLQQSWHTEQVGRVMSETERPTAILMLVSSFVSRLTSSS